MISMIPKAKEERGFSLTELVVVLLGGMILLALAVPALDTTLDQYRVVLAAQSVTSQLQFARMKAVSSNESYRVNFPAGTSDYRVETSTGAIVAGPFTLPPGIQWNTEDGGSGVTFPGRFVVFLPTGSVPASGNGATGRAKLINQSGVRVDILVQVGGSVRATPTYKTSTAPF
jgi:type II secretory pathway pseudopilin PulG